MRRQDDVTETRIASPEKPLGAALCEVLRTVIAWQGQPLSDHDRPRRDERGTAPSAARRAV